MSIAAPHAGRPRRRITLTLIAVTLVVSTLSAVFLAPPKSALAAPANTTDWLNLRSGPGLDYSVILVMEPGAYVEIVQNVQNGYYRVYYNGTSGWAAAAYLDRSGSGGGASVSPDGGGGGGGSGDATVTSALNLRSGPSTGYSVLTVMPSGASVTLNGDSSNGFLSVSYQGMSGWAYADFLSSGGGGGSWNADSTGAVVGSAVTTSALNLRSGPSTGYGVVTVMPYGASVDITGDPQNGFYPLSYGGMSGWASGDYLSSGGGGGGGSADSGGSGGDIVSIIYAAADRYGQSRADMLRVAQCESGLDPNQITAPYQASGLFQFLPGTWATTPYADQYILDPWANANAAGWMWSVGRRGEWVCQ